MARLMLLLCLFVSVPCVSTARTWYVLADSTGDAPTIPAAADSAAYGDTILVAPGVYVCPDNTDYSYYWFSLPNGVTLASTHGADATIIVDDTRSFYPHSMIDMSEGSDCKINGLTLRREEHSAWYHGVVMWKTVDCVVESCRFEGFHDAIEITGKTDYTVSPHISECSFTGSAIGIECVNIYPENTPVIENNVFSDCSWGVYCYSCAPVISRNRFTDCYWAGVYCADRSPATVTRNVVTGSVRYGFYVETTPGHEPVLFDEEVPGCGNSFYNNGECDLLYDDFAGGSTLDVRFTYWGSDCPDFAHSICANGNVNYIPWSDSTHTRILWECPAEATEPSSWGAIKAMFR